MRLARECEARVSRFVATSAARTAAAEVRFRRYRSGGARVNSRTLFSPPERAFPFIGHRSSRSRCLLMLPYSLLCVFLAFEPPRINHSFLCSVLSVFLGIFAHYIPYTGCSIITSDMAHHLLVVSATWQLIIHTF